MPESESAREVPLGAHPGRRDIADTARMVTGIHYHRAIPDPAGLDKFGFPHCADHQIGTTDNRW